MNAEPTYKYDVAISFLQQDEGLAHELNNLLSERLTTFVYFDRQKELAGTDGEVTFNQVFGQQSRIVVILYRSTWGTTPWTRIEQTAIKNRGYEEGYNFVTMIPLDERPAAQKWLPKTSIWVGLDRWGTADAAKVIEARVQESGGSTREESPLEQAARIGRQKQDKNRKLAFLNSEDGVNKANADVEVLFGEIEKAACEINETGGDISFVCKRIAPRTLNLDSLGYHMYISWICKYRTSLKESLLDVRLLKQQPFGEVRNEKGTTLSQEEFSFDVRLPDHFGWTRKHDQRFFYSVPLASHCVKQLLGRLQNDQP